MGAFVEYLLDIIFFAAVLRIAYSALRTFFGPKAARSQVQGRPAPVSESGPSREMARDPECGMFVSTEVSRRMPWKGEVLHFCSQECMEKYQSRAKAS